LRGSILSIVSVALVVLAGCGDDDEPNNISVQPSISAITPAAVALGQQNVEGRIQGQNLTGVISVNLGASIAVLQTQSVSASEILVTFTVGRDAQPGMRTISVVTSGGTANSAAIFNVENNHAPTVQFTVSPAVASKNSDVTFDASRTTDRDGSVASYQWDFGDGKSAGGKIVTHKYTGAGTFNVKLNATDNRGASNISSRSLEVENNQGPVARFTVSPAEGDVNTEYTFDGSDSTDNDGRVVKHSWDFGDGTRTQGKIVKHKFRTSKKYPVKLTVTDNRDATSEKVKEVEVGGGEVSCKSSAADPENASACGGFVGQRICVVSVNGTTMVTSEVVRICKGLCGEFRRDVEGIREFVGDILRISGTTVTMDYGRLPASTRPQPGERMKAIWRPKHFSYQKNCF
jgi:PKD repeat protein